MEFASRGVANTGLGFGIAGTTLGILNGGLGLLGNAHPVDYVTKEAFDMQREIMEKDSKIALLEADNYTDKKLVDVYTAMNDKVNGVIDKMYAQQQAQASINQQQAVFNAQAQANISVNATNIANLTSTLNALTKTVIPITNVCPQPMPLYNSWKEPTTTE